MLARKLDSIARLTDPDREALLDLPHTVRNLPARHDIVRFGDRPSHSCLVLQGWVYRYAALSEGGRQILSFYIAGDLPDLQSLHLHRMDHNLATLTSCVVALIAHEDLRQVLLSNPGLAATLWRDSLIDSAHYRERITSLGRRQALGRVAHLFCELYLRQKAVGLARGLSCPLAPKQSELADALGLTSVHLNRVLRTLRGQGLVTLSGGIPDHRGLGGPDRGRGVRSHVPAPGEQPGARARARRGRLAGGRVRQPGPARPVPRGRHRCGHRSGPDGRRRSSSSGRSRWRRARGP
ncbi:Crp/Fnr family transcriptional regulator [Methylobacterium oryzae CBMB20]